MKVLITGKNGQLVCSLLERARGHQGLELVAVGRPEVDLEVAGSAAAAIRAAGCDVVINAAAYTAVDQAEDEPERAMRINGDAAGEVAAAAADVAARVIQISTDYVFDGTLDGQYSEQMSTVPLGAYARSKREGEIQVGNRNRHHLILRTAWIYSPFGRNFLKTMMTLAKKHTRVTVVADQRGSPSSGLDLADGILTILDHWNGGGRTGFGETYHLAGNGVATWADFAEVIFDECRILGLPSATVRPIASADYPTKALRPSNSTLDSTKFLKQFGYAAPAWQESVRATVRRIAAADGS